VRIALGASILAITVGCFSGSLRPGSGPTGDTRLSSTAPLGPTAIEAFPFDYASLPMLTPVPITPDLESAYLAFLPGKDGPELRMAGGLVAEIEIGRRRIPDEEIEPSIVSRRPVPRRPDPLYRIFRDVDETGPFTWTLARGAGRLCGGSSGSNLARWQGYVHRGRSAEGLAFFCYEGTFNPRTCSVKAERAWQVRARPLVGDTVFGFRERDGMCSDPTLLHQERLALIGPRPVWIGSTAPLWARAADGVPSFARILVPVSRALSASAVLDTRERDIRIFRGDVSSLASGGLDVLSLSVEVVWAKADPSPAAIGFTSVLSGNTAAMSQSDLGGIRR
jgi:hypothetical protein